MDALKTYLRETRTTPKAFAKIIGVDADLLERMLAGELPVEASLARRMIDATGGALILDELIDKDGADRVVIDARGRLSEGASQIDVERLEEVLAACLPGLTGGERRKGDAQLPALAAEAAANTYLALSTVTTRQGPDRLVQALRPVIEEILEEMSAPEPARRRLDQATRQAAELYFQERPERRRA